MKRIMGFTIPQDATSALIESTELVMKLQEKNARLRAALEEIKFRSVSLADAQVTALEALTQPETP